MVIVQIEDIDEVPSEKWIKAATIDQEDRPGVGITHGAIGADGYRVHYADNLEHECPCGNKEFHNTVNKVMAKVTEEAEPLFMVDRRFLVEALAGLTQGLENSRDKLIFYRKKDDNPYSATPIVIQTEDQNRLAILMPMVDGPVKKIRISPIIEPKTSE